MKRNLNTILNSISTKPNVLSYNWHSSISILTFVLLHVIYVERMFSVLQWTKFLYRAVVQKRKGDGVSVDRKSKRPNVPSYFVELYYMILSILLYVLSLYVSDCLLVRILAVYFLVDTSVWVLYYFCFRRFFEENYSIMHNLEYVVLFPLVIICQSSCISILSGLTFSLSLQQILSPDASSPIYILVLSLIYTAMIFGIIISNLPSERVKVRSDHKYDISIIGNGDVVKNRLLPALMSRAEKEQKYLPLLIMDVEGKKYKSRRGYCDISYKNLNDKDSFKEIINSDIIWIASPPFSHYSYLDEFQFSDKMIVVEKPLTIFRKELDAINKMRLQSWEKVFCLSYYYQEKALPITFLYSPKNFYNKYIELSCSREETLASFEKAGSVKKIELYLNEESESRPWLSDERYGGQYFETFLHLVVISMTILGEDEDILVDSMKISDSVHQKGSLVQCHAHSRSGAEIYLESGKFMKQKRGGYIQYDNARMSVDFDKQLLEFKFNDDNQNDFKIFTKQDLVKYQIQLDMVLRCYNEGIRPSAIDGSDIQIRALQWLMEHQSFAPISPPVR